MNRLGTINLETKRLILRKFKIEDAEDMYNNWIENYNSNCYRWAIILKENNQAIGSIKAAKIDEDIEMANIGYYISRKYWNKGITSEAFERIIKFFFEEVKLNRIESCHNEKNIYSGKVMIKCGLKKEGVLREALKDNSGIANCLMYSILRTEYFKK